MLSSTFSTPLDSHQLWRDQVLDLPVGDVAAQRMALVDPIGEAGATFGFGLSRLLTVGLYLDQSLLPPAHLEPIV